jgi:hypothetical protein
MAKREVQFFEWPKNTSFLWPKENFPKKKALWSFFLALRFSFIVTENMYWPQAKSSYE